MSIAKMKMVRVYGSRDKLKDFVSACCVSGRFHSENAMDFVSSSLGFTPYNEENPYTESLEKIKEFARVAGIALKENYRNRSTEIDEKEQLYADELLERMTGLQTEKHNLEEEIAKCNESASQMKHFSGCDIPIEDMIASKFLKIRLGRMPVECYSKLSAYENENMYFEAAVEENGFIWGIYIAPARVVEKIDRIFSNLYFERIRPTETQGTPDEILEKLKARISSLESALGVVNKKIDGYGSSQAQKCIKVYNHIRYAGDIHELCRNAACYETKSKEKCFTYVGWVPTKNMKWFEAKVGGIETLYFDSFDPDDDSHAAPPVKLKNNRLFKPYEMFVKMYGLPNYGSVDVTPFVAITYILLFGIMFADLGQGFVLAVGAFLLYKFKKNELAGILIPCGCASMVFGFVFGSVFGYENMLDPLYRKLGMNGKPISAMENINTVLLIAIGIGIALVLMSMIMNMVIRIREKSVGEALFSNNGLTGAVFYAAGVCAVYNFMSGKQLLSYKTIVIVACVALPILLFKDILIGVVDRKKNFLPEKWGDFITQNLFELIEYILSYFSNTVSFLRVGAFVLVHAGMMQVFFSLAGNPYSPGGIIVIALGNAFVMCLEGLLTGIQTLRLEFYEMFSRFYEGDGRPFIGVDLKRQKEKEQDKIRK